MKLDKISTNDLISELTRRRNIQTIEVFENVGYKVRTYFKIIKSKGPATIMIIKSE